VESFSSKQVSKNIYTWSAKHQAYTRGKSQKTLVEKN